MSKLRLREAVFLRIRGMSTDLSLGFIPATMTDKKKFSFNAILFQNIEIEFKTETAIH